MSNKGPDEITVGFVTTAVVAVVGWILTARRNRTDEATFLVDAAVKIAGERREGEHDCRARLAAMEQQIAALRTALDGCTSDPCPLRPES